MNKVTFRLSGFTDEIIIREHGLDLFDLYSSAVATIYVIRVYISYHVGMAAAIRIK